MEHGIELGGAPCRGINSPDRLVAAPTVELKVAARNRIHGCTSMHRGAASGGTADEQRTSLGGRPAAPTRGWALVDEDDMA
jgi:hypothetical protein